MRYPCCRCGEPDSAPSVSGRCIPCCTEMVKEWKDEKTRLALMTKKQRKKEQAMAAEAL